MKYIKLFEHFSEYLFKNESKLKNLLMEDNDFIKGEICYAISNIGYTKWIAHKDWNYNTMLNWITNEFGKISRFCVAFSTYNGQVCNGGHVQYHDNGYASTNLKTKDNCENHDEMVDLFSELKLDKLPLGQKVYDVISKFEVELDDEIEACSICGGGGEAECCECQGNGIIECKKCGGSGEDSEGEKCAECEDGNIECQNCKGTGESVCDQCGGNGEYKTGEKIPDLNTWNRLDTEWYAINDDFMEKLNSYLGTLILDGEKISDLILLASEIKKYNL